MNVILIVPPDRPGMQGDRDKAGGLGTAFAVSRRRTPPPVTPPLDVLYTAAVVEKAGYPTQVWDAPAERLTLRLILDRLHQLGDAPPGAIGLRLSLPTLDDDLELATAIRTHLPDCSLFLFGNVIQTTLDTWQDRNPADAILFGEPEGLVLEFLEGRPHPSVLQERCQVATARWSLLTTPELEALPFPAWHLVTMSRYSPTGRTEEAVFYIQTSRGCPRACSMCPYYVHQGGAWRARSVENVLAEFAHLHGLGARRVQARDPNIGLVKKRLKAIAAGIQDVAPGLKWTLETDLESLDEATLDALAASGLDRIMTGIESVDPVILREIHQHPDALDLTVRNIKRCQERGIALTGFLVIGSHSETFDSVKRTIERVKGWDMDVSLSVMTPYPGTVYREEAVAQGHVDAKAPPSSYSGTTCLVRSRALDQKSLGIAHAWAGAQLSLAHQNRRMRRARGWDQGIEHLRRARRWGQARYWDARLALARRQVSPVSGEKSKTGTSP